MVIIGHIVMAYVNVLQVLWVTLCGEVFDGWRHISPVLVLLVITSNILCRELNICVLVNGGHKDMTVPITDHETAHTNMTTGWRVGVNWTTVG